jgi:hypothetical protein
LVGSDDANGNGIGQSGQYCWHEGNQRFSTH